jgi:excisionase family DNA binding protein
MMTTQGEAPVQPTPAETLLDVNDLARLLDCSQDTVYRMVKDPALGFPTPIFFGGRRMRWRASEYNAWVKLRAEMSAEQYTKRAARQRRRPRHD